MVLIPKQISKFPNLRRTHAMLLQLRLAIVSDRTSVGVHGRLIMIEDLYLLVAPGNARAEIGSIELTTQEGEEVYLLVTSEMNQGVETITDQRDLRLPEATVAETSIAALGTGAGIDTTVEEVDHGHHMVAMDDIEARVQGGETQMKI